MEVSRVYVSLPHLPGRENLNLLPAVLPELARRLGDPDPWARAACLQALPFVKGAAANGGAAQTGAANGGDGRNRYHDSRPIFQEFVTCWNVGF